MTSLESRHVDFQDKRPKDKPDRLKLTRRGLAVGALTAVLTGMGAWKAIELGTDAASAVTHQATENPYNAYDCHNDGLTTQVHAGETAWDTAARPLAEQLGIETAKAMRILDAANPGIDLGNLDVNSTIEVPLCDTNK